MRDRVSPVLQRLSPFHGRSKDPKAGEMAREEARYEALRKDLSTSPIKKLEKRVKGSKKAERAKPFSSLERQAAFDDIPMPDGRKVVNLHEVKPIYKYKKPADKQTPSAGPSSGRKAREYRFNFDGKRVEAVEIEEEDLASSPEPEAVRDDSSLLSEKAGEAQAFRFAFGRASQTIYQAKDDLVHLGALKDSLFMESTDVLVFGERFKAFSRAAADFKATMVDAFNAAYDAVCELQDVAPMAEWTARLAELGPLHDGMKEACAEAEAMATLSSLDCYRLPFLRQDHRFLGDLDKLVRLFGMEADPALQAYQQYYVTLATVNEVVEAVALGLKEMPQLFERAVEYSELRELYGQRDTLHATWEQMQARLQEARRAVEAFGNVIAHLEVDPADADIAQRWQEQYQADAQGFAALVESFEEEHLHLYQEYVAPSHQDLFVRVHDIAAGIAKPAADRAAVEKALERAEALAIALRIDAKLPRELFAALQATGDESVFVEKLKGLVGEKHWIGDKLLSLRGRIEKVQAVTAEDMARLEGLRESIAAVVVGLPPVLDRKALSQTAFIEAHPERIDAMLAKLKAFEHDYIADEANDEDAEADPIHRIYEEQLYRHFAGLKNWELLAMQGRALEEAYGEVLRMAPGSVEAFLAARKAFDSQWVPHAYAHQALQADIKALEEAIAHVDEPRQRYWRPVVQHADTLLQPEAFAALFISANKCTLPAIKGHFKEVLVPGRKAFLEFLAEIQQDMRVAENALVQTLEARAALLGAATPSEAIAAAKAFLATFADFTRLLDTTIDGFDEAEEFHAYREANEQDEEGVGAVIFRLDKEAVAELSRRIDAVTEVTGETCLISEKQLAAIPGVKGNDRALKAIRSILAPPEL